MKRTLLSLLICALVIGIGASLVAVALALRNSRSQAVEKPPEKIPNVKVQILKTATLEDSLMLTGTVEPWEDLTLSAEIPGKIEWQGADEGDTVKAGQGLFKIDTSTVQAAVDQATAQHKLTIQEYERQERLSKGGMSTPQARDRALADRDVAAANVRAAEVRLAKSAVKSPIDAVVDRIRKKKDEFVDNGTPLVRLVQIHKVKVVVGIPERDVTFFAVGNPVNVAFDALPGKAVTGRIHRIGTTAEMATHTFTTEIELDNRERDLKPGMVARASLVRKAFPEAIAVPVFSVISLENQRFVFVEDGGIARVRPVEVGILRGSFVQVTGGLSAGERLIVVGQRDARDGAPVKVQEVLE